MRAKADTTPGRSGATACWRRPGAPGVPARSAERVHPRHTVVINAVTERSGAPTALVTTRGFRDVLEIGRANRPDLYNLAYAKPVPFVPQAPSVRGHRADDPPRRGGRAAQRRGRRRGCRDGSRLRAPRQSQSACCMRGPTRRTRSSWPSRCATSCRACPWSARTRSAASGGSTREPARQSCPRTYSPLSRATWTRSGRRCAGWALPRRCRQCARTVGCARSPARRKRRSALLESGPVAGVMAAAELGRRLGNSNVLTLDIGGTTAKTAAVRDGEVRIDTLHHVGRTPAYRRLSGSGPDRGDHRDRGRRRVGGLGGRRRAACTWGRAARAPIRDRRVTAGAAPSPR